MFTYNEYHIYTTDDRRNRNYVHLTKEDLDETIQLHKEVNSSADDWKTTHRKKVSHNIYLSVGDGLINYPIRLQTHGYEGWVPVDDGKFEEELFFDSALFYKCVGTQDFGPEKSFNEMKKWVNDEHQEEFERRFNDYLSKHYSHEDVVVDW